MLIEMKIIFTTISAFDVDFDFFLLVFCLEERILVKWTVEDSAPLVYKFNLYANAYQKLLFC